MSLDALKIRSHTAHASFSVIPMAWAHPGHGSAEEVVGELLGPWTLDLLGEPLALGEALLYEGPTGEAELELAAEPAAVVAGVAVVDGEALPFAFTLALDERVTGLPFAHELDAAAPPAELSLSVDLSHALSFVDWRAPDDDGDGALTEADGAIPETARFGLSSVDTYTLTLED